MNNWLMEYFYARLFIKPCVILLQPTNTQQIINKNTLGWE